MTKQKVSKKQYTPITITKIKCPSCEGSGNSKLFAIPCLWCNGEKKINRKVALHWADVMWMFAGGGYIAGDNSFEEMREQEAYAIKIVTMFGEPNRYKVS